MEQLLLFCILLLLQRHVVWWLGFATSDERVEGLNQAAGKMLPSRASFCRPRRLKGGVGTSRRATCDRLAPHPRGNRSVIIPFMPGHQKRKPDVPNKFGVNLVHFKTRHTHTCNLLISRRKYLVFFLVFLLQTYL